MIREAPAGCPVEPGFDPLAPEFLAEPMAMLTALPAECRPLFYAPLLDDVVVTGHAEIDWVLRHPEGRPHPEVQIDIATSMAAYRGYLGAFVAVRAGERADDLTGDLLAIHDEDPDQLTLAEITSILFSLSFAGHATTTGLIGNAVRRLLERPERWAAVAADAALIEPAVDETLRHDTSVPAWRRVTTTVTTLAGVELAEGTQLLLWIAASNRDPAVFAAPDGFDLHLWVEGA